MESAIEASLAEDSSDSDSTEISDAERHAQLKSIAEALIFSTNEPLTEAQFLTVVGRHAKGMLAGLVAELNADYVHTGRSIEILHVAKGYQFFTRPEYAHALKKLFTERSRTRLSRAALESLAVIAFRGPVTRAEIDEIRGVESSGVIRTLLDRRLVQVKGRAEVIGRPMLYETTEEFLRHFGLSSLDDLPKHHELTREWGELQESSKESDADVQEQNGIQADPDNEAGSDIEAASGEIGTHEKDKIDTPDVTGDENGHNNQFTVNRENKPLDSEQ
ncbi:SMC-Scp complex subunit ScpB [bacterium]|nr:MAG: SMC-Scp complex subunit ScpB [bacterium]